MTRKSKFLKVLYTLEGVESVISSYHPFSNTAFLHHLEKTRVVGDQSGWHPLYFCAFEEKKLVALHFAYVKLHSYGEYIFDWNWAEFYQKNQIPYYPKLLSALPFTPISAPKFIGDSSYFDKLFKMRLDFVEEQGNSLSSDHILFSGEIEDLHFKELYFKKVTHQYHFNKSFSNFNEFLASLRSRKRKQVKKERSKAQEYFEFQRKKYSELSSVEKERIYSLYLSTIEKKWSHAYLNREFFLKLDLDNFLIELAYQGSKIVAMSLLAASIDTLFGRYWGVDTAIDSPYLHFELCYYRPLELMMELKLNRFEAGAQGEQKLLRGFEAVTIGSYHRHFQPQIHQVLSKHTEEMNQISLKEIDHLNKKYLPYNDKNL